AARGLLEDVVEGQVPVVGEAVLQLQPVEDGGCVEAGGRGGDVVPELELEVARRLGGVLVGADQRAPVGARGGGEEQQGGGAAEGGCDSHSRVHRAVSGGRSPVAPGSSGKGRRAR